MMKGSATARKPSTAPTTTTSSIAAYSAARPKQTDFYEDYSEAVENWRLKREQKRKQSLSTNRIEDEPSTPAPITQPSPPPTPVKQIDASKPNLPPPPPPTATTKTAVPTSTKTNKSFEQLSISNRKTSESPTAQRPKGPSRIREISIQKPSDVRGFGFKSDGGHTLSRPIYISSIEDGSPADKAGLSIDDEIISINDENIEHMTFDQVRKILTERNRRGSIKLLVRTFDDGIDDTSQTVTTEHSRTPSPHRILSTSNTNTSVLATAPMPRPPPPPAPLSSMYSAPAQTSTIRVSSTTPTNVQSPVYTFLPYAPSPVEKSVPQTPTSSVNIFAPKPFRSTTSNNLETQNATEKSIDLVEQSTSKSTPRDVVNSLLSNPTLISSTIIDAPTTSTNIPKSSPPPLSSVESLLHGRADFDTNNQQRQDSPIAQVRSSVEKQMNQLQQELLLGFPHTQPSSRNQPAPINIPIDFTNAAIPSKTSRRNSNETALFYYESTDQQRPTTTTSNYTQRPSTATSNYTQRTSTERSTNELRINLSSPSAYQQQQRVSLPPDDQLAEQRITNKQLHSTLNQAPKKTSYEDQSWITDEQRKSLINSTSTTLSNNIRTNHNDRRSASLTPRHHHDIQIEKQSSNQLSTFQYGDQTDENRHQRHHHSRTNQQQRDFDPSIHRQHQSKQRRSPVRTTINSNNNRVLSVSGKLRCSRCNDELGQGSAMVIESLGLYYHIECFRCFVCNIPLSSSFEGTDVRVRSNRLHCQNCFSDENGAWRSNV